DFGLDPAVVRLRDPDGSRELAQEACLLELWLVAGLRFGANAPRRFACNDLFAFDSEIEGADHFAAHLAQFFDFLLLFGETLLPLRGRLAFDFGDALVEFALLLGLIGSGERLAVALN